MRINHKRPVAGGAGPRSKKSRKLSSQLSPLVHQYLEASLSENTRRAYRNDLDHFLNWGGKIPATPECVATYLAEHATKLSFATLSRRTIAISKAHTAVKLQSPTHTEIIKATLQGIRRTTRRARRQVAPAILPQVQTMIKKVDGLRGLRDKALLLIGFAGAFRRSELVSIRVDDIEFVEKGVVVRIRRSKTDQHGNGRDIAIPYVRGSSCPVKALKAWMDKAEVKSGFLFRGVNRHGRVLDNGLTSQSVALIIKQRAGAIGLNASKYSGHSLRAGLVTSAAMSGVSNWKICQQTGHQSVTVMQKYVRDSQLFVNNPLSHIW